ncbi:putative ELMO domain-containing protein [Helianthus debilis subsp. tardiflorus]
MCLNKPRSCWFGSFTINVYAQIYLYEALRALWKAAFPEEELRDLISEQWKEMGWQGKDPSTDFRGGGFISLENLLYLARNFPKSFQDLLKKQEGERAMWEYPFAVAGVNITFMLIQMLDLEAGTITLDTY